MKAKLGRIVTFYSYKGGTGRSLLLANAALVLASNDRRVAVIDWDLEAPGLHRYFRPFIADTELTETTGLIDLFTGYWDKLIELESAETEPPAHWEQPYLDVYRYAVTLRMPGNAAGGQIVFVPAGRQNAAYASKVSNFDWDAFYSNAGGRGFIDALAARLRDEFDYVLIDSRTGVSDTAGICTIHLPDDLVICFTYNNQNVLGAAAVAANARQARLGRDDVGRLRIFPVPTRADYFLQTYLEPRRRFARARMDWVLPDEEQRDPAQYWAQVEQPYLPVHSYFETLACLTDDPAAPPPSLLLATQNVVRRFTGGDVQRWIPMFDDADRLALRAEMEREPGNSATAPAANATPPVTAPPPPPAPAPSPPAWSERDYADARPLLLRLMRWHDGGQKIEYRTVSSALFDHLSRHVERMLVRGLLVVLPGQGGSSLIELSSFARADETRMRTSLQDFGTLNERLLDIEESARRWRAAGGRDQTLLKDARWLDAAAADVEALKSQHVLTPSEELYLLACSRRIEQGALRRKALVAAAAGAGLLVVLTVLLTRQKVDSAQLLADAQATAQSLQARVDESAQRLSTLERQARDSRFAGLLGQGHDAFSRSSYAEAVAFFSEAAAVALTPNADLYRARGDAYDRLASRASSPSERDTLRQKSLSDFDTWVSLAETASRQIQVAELQLRNGQTARAIEHLDRAARIAARDPSSLVVDRGMRLTQQLRKQGAISSTLAADLEALFRASIARPKAAASAASG